MNFFGGFWQYFLEICEVGISLLFESWERILKIRFWRFLAVLPQFTFCRFVAEGTKTAHDDQPAKELESIAWTVSPQIDSDRW